jgi:hypothetical protein
MNIPTMTRASFKTRERETGKAVEAVAGHTRVETIEIEKEHAIKIRETRDENNLVPISCSYIQVCCLQGFIRSRLRCPERA